MGLDMYAYVRTAPLPAVVDFEQTEADQRIFYWRKHPNLHGWMERLYRTKGGTDPDFILATLALTAEDLDALEQDLTARALPETSGFFFGQSSEEDIVDDLAFLATARRAIAEGSSVYYTSWW